MALLSSLLAVDFSIRKLQIQGASLFVLRFFARVLVVVSAISLLPVTLLELLLRRWVRRPVFSLKRALVGPRRHGVGGSGSWIADADLMVQRDTEYSPEFHREAGALGTAIEKELWKPSPAAPTINRLTGSYEGKFFSVSNGERSTSFSQTEATNEVFCLGGSTTFCTEVRDISTWPSVLQRLVVEAGHGANYRCRNLGIPGTPGLERIWALPYVANLQRGDVSVFLFGDNDSGWKMYGNREGMYWDNLPRILRLVGTLADFLETAGWLYGEISPRYLRRLAVEMAETTIAAAEDAAKFAQSRGANVLFVLQPNIFTLARLDDWDRKIIAGTARDLPIMLAAAYERYREWIAVSPIAVDATHIFDGESPSPYMADWGHVNTRGNRLIGEFVFDQLKTRGLLIPTANLG